MAAVVGRKTRCRLSSRLRREIHGTELRTSSSGKPILAAEAALLGMSRVRAALATPIDSGNPAMDRVGGGGGGAREAVAKDAAATKAAEAKAAAGANGFHCSGKRTSRMMPPGSPKPKGIPTPRTTGALPADG